MYNRLFEPGLRVRGAIEGARHLENALHATSTPTAVTTKKHTKMYSHFSFIVNDRTGDGRSIHFHGYFSHIDDNWTANARVMNGKMSIGNTETVRRCDTLRLPNWPFKIHLEDIRAHFWSNLTGLVDKQRLLTTGLTCEEFLCKEMFRGPLLNPDFEYIASRFEKLQLEDIMSESDFKGLAKNAWQVERSEKALERYVYKKYGILYERD